METSRLCGFLNNPYTFRMNRNIVPALYRVTEKLHKFSEFLEDFRMKVSVPVTYVQSSEFNDEMMFANKFLNKSNFTMQSGSMNPFEIISKVERALSYIMDKYFSKLMTASIRMNEDDIYTILSKLSVSSKTADIADYTLIGNYFEQRADLFGEAVSTNKPRESMGEKISRGLLSYSENISPDSMLNDAVDIGLDNGAFMVSSISRFGIGNPAGLPVVGAAPAASFEAGLSARFETADTVMQASLSLAEKHTNVSATGVSLGGNFVSNLQLTLPYEFKVDGDLHLSFKNLFLSKATSGVVWTLVQAYEAATTELDHMEVGIVRDGVFADVYTVSREANSFTMRIAQGDKVVLSIVGPDALASITRFSSTIGFEFVPLTRDSMLLNDNTIIRHNTELKNVLGNITVEAYRMLMRGCLESVAILKSYDAHLRARDRSVRNTLKVVIDEYLTGIFDPNRNIDVEGTSVSLFSVSDYSSPISWLTSEVNYIKDGTVNTVTKAERILIYGFIYGQWVKRLRAARLDYSFLRSVTIV